MALPQKGEVSVSKTTRLLILTVTLLAVLVHTFQAVVFSGGESIPGDLSDARYTQLVLEHLYQSLLGYQEWSSPAHFHPQEGTLYYSDAHWGTFVLYLVARLFGISMGSSFQWWMMSIQVLNVLAMFYLLGTLGLPWTLRPFLCFFTLAGFHMTSKVGVGHLAILILFPFILSLAFLIRFVSHRRAWDLCLSLLCLTGQHYGYAYLGHFGLFVWTAVILSALVFPIDPCFRKELGTVLKKNWRLFALTGVVCLLALLVLYQPYVAYMSTREARSAGSTRSLSPHIHFWFSSSANSLLYYWQDFLGEKAHRGESELFNGWIIWVIAVLSFLLYRRSRSNSRLRLAMVLLLSCLGLALFFTAIGKESSGWSPYLALAKIIKSIRAFRAVGRVSFLIVVLEGVLAGIVLNEMIRNPSKTWRAWGWALACLLVLDVVAIGQSSFSKEIAHERGNRLAEAVMERGTQPVFAYMPGSLDERRELVHLDSWHAAILTRRRTVNGFSGNYPETHMEFFYEPTKENLILTLKRVGLSLKEVLVIEEDLTQPKKAER